MIKLRKKHLSFFLLAVLLMAVLQTGGMAKYLCVLLLIPFIIAKNGWKIDIRYFIIAIPSVLCAFFGDIKCLILDNLGNEAFKETCFLLIPALFVCLFFSEKKGETINDFINMLFWAIMCLFFIHGIMNFNASDWMESTHAFIMGIYAIYYLYAGEFFLFFVAITGVILSHKRIVWIITLCCLLFFKLLCICKKRKNNKKKKTIHLLRFIGIGFVIMLLLYVYCIRSEYILRILEHYQILSYGRTNIWRNFTDIYYVSPDFSGIGLGEIQPILAKLGINAFGRLHSDVLMYYIELGFIGFIILFYSYFFSIELFVKKCNIAYKDSVLILTLVIYTLGCYMTDNISIYIQYMIPYYMILGNVIHHVIEYSVLDDNGIKKRIKNNGKRKNISFSSSNCTL